MGRSGKSIVPDATDWSAVKNNLDNLEVDHLRSLFFGKTVDEVQEYFGDTKSIERSGELLFAPRRVFQYYVHAFANFMHSSAAKGDPDSASPFLSLLEAREERDPGSVSEIYSTLIATITFVSERQDYFDADIKIYGDFKDIADRVAALCRRLPRR